MKKILFYLFLLLSIKSAFGVEQKIEVKTAGTLLSLISDKLKVMTDLTITGELNNKDIAVLKKMGTSEILRNLDLSKVTIKDDYGNVTNSIPSEAFRSASKLESIVLPQSVVSIGEYFAAECNLLKSIVLPENLEQIMELTFVNCNTIDNIIISEKNKYFKTEENVLFTKDGSELILYLSTKNNEEYTIPEGVKNIRIGSIESCSYIKTLNFPKTLETIEGWTCRFLPNLKNIDLPKSLRAIGPFAFQGSGINKVYLKSNTPPTLDRDAFNDSKKSCIVFVPKGYYYNYWIDNLWSSFENIEEYDYIDEGDDTANEKINFQEPNFKIQTTTDGFWIKSIGNKTVNIFTINGCLIKQINSLEEQFIPLPSNNYIITNGTQTQKAVIH